MSNPRVLFFGVASGTGAGHYLRDPSYRLLREAAVLPPALHRIDSVWTRERPRTVEEARNRGTYYGERAPETQGCAFIHYVSGWTIVAWWDRSEDKRGGCNANFLAEGRFGFATMIDLARKVFPREMRRMEAAYPITLAGPDLPVDDVEDAACAFVASLDALHPSVRDAVWAILRGRLRGGDRG